jgi:hypothetical protein
MRLAPALSAAVVVAILGTAPAFADENGWVERYRSMSLQEPGAPAPKPEAEPAAPEGEGEVFADLFEVGVHIGAVVFSGDFEADPEFSAGITGRAALPWFSKTLLGMEDRAAFGLFVDLTVSAISRDIPVLEEPDGTLIFFTIGLDYSVYRDETFVVRPQMGLQFGHFGGVTDLDNGLAFVLGVEGGVTFAEGFRAVFIPQLAIGDGDTVFFLNLGVVYSF